VGFEAKPQGLSLSKKEKNCASQENKEKKKA
jgi:hypothetical protein